MLMIDGKIKQFEVGKVEDKDDPIKSTPVNTTPESTPATETQAAPSTGLGGTRFKF